MPPHMMHSTAQMRPRESAQKMLIVASAGDTEILAVGESERAYIYYYVFSNGAAAMNRVGFKIGSGDVFDGEFLKEGGTTVHNIFQAEIVVPSGESLYVNLTGDGTVAVTIHYSKYVQSESLV